MKVFRFYKDHDNWYIDLPDYLEQGGSVEELQMVDGADSLLDILAHGETSVILRLDLLPFENCGTLTKLVGGLMEGYYEAVEPQRKLTMQIWLCPVTRYVFGKYPQQIHFKKLTKHEFKDLNVAFVSGIYEPACSGEEAGS